MPASHPFLRRTTTSVLAAVALVSGSILLLGDRFEAAGNAALTQPVHVEARIAACVADESMRLIDPDRDRCRPDERELASEQGGRTAPAGPAGRASAEGVPGFELVTAGLSVPARARATGQARCPAGKAAVGGGARPDPDAARRPGTAGAGDGMELSASGPVPADGAGGYGWEATVENTSAAPLGVIVATICAAAR